MLASEHLHYFFFKLIHRVGVIIGLEFMMPTFKISWRTVMFLLAIGIGYICLAYTIFSKDRMSAFRCSTIVAVTLQGTVKYIVLLANAPSLSKHLAFLQRVYRQCDAFRSEASRLISWAKVSKKGIVIFVCLFCVAEAGFCALPPYLFATTGKMVLLLPVFIPGFDETTPSGFVGQTVCQIIFMLMMLVGMTGSDSSIFLYIVQMCPLSEIIVLKLRILNDVLLHNDVEKRSDSDHRRIRCYLNNIVCMHVELVHYVGEVSKLFYVIFMVEILFDGLGMCLIIFVNMQEVWFPLYMFWIAYLFKTFLVCLLGTMAEHYVSVLKVTRC